MKILIADDSVDFCTTIADVIKSMAYDTENIQNPIDTINYIDRQFRNISLLLLDIEFAPADRMTGLDILEHCRRNHPSIPVIMISGKGTIETAVRATKLGAINFIEKSILSKDKLREVIDSAMEKLTVKGEAKDIRNFLESQGIIGKSSVIIDIGDSIIRFGRTDLNVLISGETGTGKRLVAQALHTASRRAKYPFVHVDIPNIPRDLFQSELFGFNKGSFTGATDTRKGLFSKANKGTLFLDEIGDLSLDSQSKLFIPIEEKSIRKLGSVEREDIDVRFISATDKDLLSAIKESKFREQLYHRLRECEIYLPPLKERPDDIPEIIEFYLKRHNNEYKQSKFISPSAIEYLQEQSWQGNVRELVNTLRVSLQTVSSDQIEVADIYKVLSKIVIQQQHEIISPDGTLKEDLEKVDKEKIIATLLSKSGNVTKSAAALGISRETLHNKIRKYGIKMQEIRVRKETE